jgi:CRISPR/Cas system-associated protein Cas10 (large subunit of type III CRISPR-Cas system)
MKPDKPSPAEILAKMAQIQSMERGKLSSYRRSGRSKEADTYYRLQTWQEGKNRSRHVRPEELPGLEAALEGYAQYCELSDLYVQMIVERTRAQQEHGFKKKIQPYSRHCRKKSNGSSNRS